MGCDSSRGIGSFSLKATTLSSTWQNIFFVWFTAGNPFVIRSDNRMWPCSKHLVLNFDKITLEK